MLFLHNPLQLACVAGVSARVRPLAITLLETLARQANFNLL